MIQHDHFGIRTPGDDPLHHAWRGVKQIGLTEYIAHQCYGGVAQHHGG